MPFIFEKNGSDAAILHDGTPILRLQSNRMDFGGVFLAREQWMRPGGGPEVAELVLFSAYRSAAMITDVSYEAEITPDMLRLKMTPLASRAGTAGMKPFTETDMLTVRLQEGRYAWTQEMVLRIHADLDINDPATAHYLRIYHFPHQDGTPGRFLQFADPQPVGASGPAVPMTRDWLQQFEPYVGPDSFRAQWRRRYVAIVLENLDGSYATSDLNKTKWAYLTQDNRRARPCHPQGMTYLLKDTGEALAARCDAPTYYHHVCEWGMDFHFWLDLEPFLKNDVLPKGTEIRAATHWRMVDAEETAPIVKSAKPIALTEREFFFANLPAYEEPENTFTVSALDRLDAQPWTPTSEGCSWSRTGGKTADTGCLVIQNNFGDIGEWEQGKLGPSQWANPFVPGGTYRLSAWVKIENLEINTPASGPQVGITFTQYNGPASVSSPTQVDGGWSPSIFATRDFAYPGELPWTLIELITTAPSYALDACLRLRFQGRGTAYFSNVRWEQVLE